MFRRICLFIGALAVVAGCGSSPDAPPAADAAEPATAQARADFCEVWVTMLEEVPESYVGSAEHVADIQGLLDVALPEIAADIALFRDFLASGEVDAEADPDSNLTENWPIAVQNAIDDVQDVATDLCGT